MNIFTGKQNQFLGPSKFWLKHLSLSSTSLSSSSSSSTQRKWQKPVVGFDTNIKIYNCTVKEKVPIILKNKNLATWYSCGPTVYDSAHIGHACCYVKLDIIQRILRKYFHINLITAMNITDIDDKIINKSYELKNDWKTIGTEYEKEFWTDLKRLNIQLPDITVRVTDYIPIICKFIEKLLLQDIAYETKDGSVYFNVNKYLEYGKLQNINNIETRDMEQQQSNDIDNNGDDLLLKKNVQDFALWKASKLNEPYWLNTWNNKSGRPGWHIECSALASMLFGSEIDFHAGGIDLRFPHHENEEAQSCARHNTKQWINYWIHTGHLHCTGHAEKMSKSLKNTISITELLEKYSSNAFRMACCLSNYRNQMDYSDEIMNKSDRILERIQTFLIDSLAYVRGDKPRCNKTLANTIDLYGKLEETIERVDANLRDDFNTSKMIENILELINNGNKIINSNSNNDELSIEATDGSDLYIIQGIHNFIDIHLNILGFNNLLPTKSVCELQSYTDDTKYNNNNIVEIIDGLLKIRNDIREIGKTTKNLEYFAISDKIRLLLQINGIEIKDYGKLLTTWKFKN